MITGKAACEFYPFHVMNGFQYTIYACVQPTLIQNPSHDRSLPLYSIICMVVVYLYCAFFYLLIGLLMMYACCKYQHQYYPKEEEMSEGQKQGYFVIDENL